MSCNGQLWRPGGISPLCFSATRFILGICLLIKTSKDLTPSQRIRFTRSSHNSQYCRPQTYSDALKYSFFPMTTPHWNCQSPAVAEFWPLRTPKKKSLTTHSITITSIACVFSHGWEHHPARPCRKVCSYSTANQRSNKELGYRHSCLSRRLS